MAVRGSSLTTATASGSLWRARSAAAKARSSARDGGSPGFAATTIATPTSPITGSGRGTTATWATLG